MFNNSNLFITVGEEIPQLIGYLLAAVFYGFISYLLIQGIRRVRENYQNFFIKAHIRECKEMPVKSKWNINL